MDSEGPTGSSSRKLHNFNLPGISWGRTRFLRCIKNAESSSGASARRANANPNASFTDPLNGKRKGRENSDGSLADIHRRSDFGKSGFPETERFRLTRLPPEAPVDGYGISTVREKLLIDLHNETEKIKVAIFKEGLDTAAAKNPPPLPPPRPVAASTVETEARPWKLRERRVVSKAPKGCTSSAKTPMPPKMKNDGNSATTNLPANRTNFSVALSQREIEEDLFAFTGRKPSRRPQKRPKHVQRALDILFPGLWLSEINADMYKVPETR